MTSIIAEIAKNSKEKLIVSVVEYKGHMLIDTRVHFEDIAGTWRPTKKGIILNDQTAEKVIDALEKAISELRGQSGSTNKNTGGI
jgi:hypothetical protein